MDKVAKPVVANTFGAQQHAQDCLGGAANGHGGPWKDLASVKNGQKKAEKLQEMGSWLMN